MRHINYFSRILFAAGVAMLASSSFAQTTPYKIANIAQLMGAGGIDYVYADNDGRRLYVPRGGAVLVFDLDTLKPVGSLTNARAHGATVDAKSHHGFASSKPVVMWDTQTLETIKTIDVQGGPDGILYEPFTQRVYVLSHSAPNVTVIDPKDGTVVGTIDLGGAPEQGQSDGMGHVYIDVENKANVAVVDATTLMVTAHYDLSSKASTPAGLALDIKNHILFAMCRQPATCVVLDATDGKILTSLPLAGGSDGAVFNAATMEAFSSHGNGTLSVLKENSPTSFEVEQTVATKSGAKTCTLDTKNNQIVLITIERPAAATNAPVVAAASPAGTNQPAGERRNARGGGNNGPAMLDILVVGR
jgi:hypothetical protein